MPVAMALDVCRRELLLRQAAARNEHSSKQLREEEELRSLRSELQILAQAAVTTCSQRLEEDTSLLRQLEGTRSTLLRLSAELRSVQAQNERLRDAAAARALQREEQRELQEKAAKLRRALEKATACRDRLQRQTSELEDQAATQQRLARAYEEGAEELRTELRHALRHLKEQARPEHTFAEESKSSAASSHFRDGSEIWEPLLEGTGASAASGIGFGWHFLQTSASAGDPMAAFQFPAEAARRDALEHRPDLAVQMGSARLELLDSVGKRDYCSLPGFVLLLSLRRFLAEILCLGRLSRFAPRAARAMTIGIDLLRKDKGGDPEVVRESERRRFRDPKIVDQVLELDGLWVKQKFQLDEKRKEVNKVQSQITEKKKASKGQDKCEDLLQQKTALEGEAADFEKVVEETQAKRDKLLGAIGNLVHDTVPVSQDEDKDNKVVATWGVPRSFEGKTYQANGFRPHFELLEMIGAVEFDAGLEVAGHRGYFLSGPGVLLNQALINYGLAFLSQRGYTPLQPPFFMKKDLMAKTAELADYDDVLYKVIEDKEHPELDKYLIATSEQPISAFHRGQTIDKTRFPLRYVGYSSCFRREAGSSGRDIRGIFRVHQFEKIEQFVLTDPEKSWEEHESMIAMAQEFYQSLGIPYRTVAIVSGELNNAAAKKYDLEGWFPGDNEGKGKYRELVSCSNCLDYQARAMQTKFGYRPEDPFCHMLNSTLCATERALCSIVENYQEQDGVRVPRALVPFLLGQEFFPFVKTVKEERPAAKGKAKSKK
ncbi:unnamed protein product [Symbiodinium sp. CCMP2592]|nr:unnamed protein product [Symbiodinium sp. CCMP2592]